MERIPLLEYDDDPTAIIDPSVVFRNISPPEHCVMPIYGSVIEKLRSEGRLERIHRFACDLAPLSAYVLEHEDQRVTVAHPGVGAPLAAAIFEELIALGCRKFVACGSAGVLKSELKRGALVIPSSAVRDEGTSYHYCSPSRTLEVDQGVVARLESVLQKHGVRYEVGKTWTTDAIYRETRNKIDARRAEGCLTVEMECAAFLAVAKFRGVTFGQLLAAGDDVGGDEWDPRLGGDRLSLQERIFWLSVEACLSL